jgi:hypothetical protein
MTITILLMLTTGFFLGLRTFAKMAPLVLVARGRDTLAPDFTYFSPETGVLDQYQASHHPTPGCVFSLFFPGHLSVMVNPSSGYSKPVPGKPTHMPEACVLSRLVVEPCYIYMLYAVFPISGYSTSTRQATLASEALFGHPCFGSTVHSGLVPFSGSRPPLSSSPPWFGYCHAQRCDPIPGCVLYSLLTLWLSGGSTCPWCRR